MNLADIIGNEESRLARFPIAREKIFLSHAAVTALPHCAAQAMADYAYSSCKDHQEFPEFMETMNETRRLSANLIGAEFSEIALLGPTSLGLSLFAKGISWEPNDEVICYLDDYPANVYPWMELVRNNMGIIEKIDSCNEKSITEKLIDRINEQVIAVAIPNIRWTDGYVLDLERISIACKNYDVKLILDLTQSAGAMEIDLSKIKPDFAIIANYKWMLGPYSTGFMYVSDNFIEGIPLEETWIGRKNSEDFSKLTVYQSEYNFDSIRFDMGQRANFTLMPGVMASLEQLHDWGIKNIENTLYENNKIICKGLNELGFDILEENKRAPHFISAKLPSLDGNLVIKKLKMNNIFISERSGYLRITPHLWNNEQDFLKLLECLKLIIN